MEKQVRGKSIILMMAAAFGKCCEKIRRIFGISPIGV